MCRCFLLILCVLALPTKPVAAQILEARPDSPALQQMRQAKRQASYHSLSLPEKIEEPLLSGLLVIPVDFSDARLPSGWDSGVELAPRLFPNQGETLHHFFSVASCHNLDLQITLAPVVHLEGTRRQYSDRHLNGFTRTRSLAHEALSKVKEMGLVFRSLDMEGPDRIPGSNDDDGDLDGILILHSGPGQENDPVDGWVQALQFYLEDPVFSDGISASYYAVASMYSGLGIWAHETGHLLGLEDRYDPTLHPFDTSEIQSRGGLGRFSLMASGALGTGGGSGCSLPDAYSSIQMGWQQPLNLPAFSNQPQTLFAAVSGGTCARIWTESILGPEFFLLETRDPVAAAPFDAAIAANQLLIYHVDENVPDGGWVVDGPSLYHLRIHLLEADGGNSLRQGLNNGSEATLFPGISGNSHVGNTTIPSSSGYTGPTQVDLNNIRSLASGVEFDFGAALDNAVTFTSNFNALDDNWSLFVEATSVGTHLNELACTVEALGSNTFGSFPGGLSEIQLIFSSSDGIHWTTDQSPMWTPDSDDLGGKTTVFGYTFRDPSSGWEQETEIRQWLWQGADSTLDFAALWPGQWVVEHPGNNLNTTWHLWQGAPYITADQSPVLACTGNDYTSAENWADISYQNNAWTTLTSGPIDPQVVGVRIIHTAEIEFLSTGLTADGAVLAWISSDGKSIPALPLQPWSAMVRPGASHVLRGLTTFGCAVLDTLDGQLHWRDDVVPMPPGPGPWRLQFVFASNQLWRFKGWFVAKIEPLTVLDNTSPFQAETSEVSKNLITWNWPHQTAGAGRFQIQTKDISDNVWEILLEDHFEPCQFFEGVQTFCLYTDRIFNLTSDPNRKRNSLRIVGELPLGKLTSNSFALYEDGGHSRNIILSTPWPNPATDNVKLELNIPNGTAGNLRIYDVAGRCVFSKFFPEGKQFFLWEGQNSQGQQLSSGTYILKLDGPDFSESNKVVFVH